MTSTAHHRWRGWPGHLTPLRLDAATSRSTVARGVLSTTGLLVQGVMRFAVSFLTGRLLGKAALGVVQSAISTGVLLSLLWPTTTGSAASKYLSRARGADDDVELHAVANHLRRRTFQASVLIGVAAAALWMVLDDADLTHSVPVGIFAAAYSGYSFTRGVQFGAGQVPRATTWDLISAGVGLAAFTAALLLGVRGTFLLLPLSAAYAAYTVASWPYSAAGRPAAPLRRELDHFVLLGAAGTVASTGLLQLSMIVAKAVGGRDGAGQYAAAFAIATPASLLATSLSLVLFPSLAEAWGRGDRAGFRAQTDQATRVLVLAMTTVFGSLALCSPLVVGVIWGKRFADATQPFDILVMAILASNVAVASSNALLTGFRRGVLVTTSASLSGLAVGALAWLLLTPHLGVVGVALGYLAGTVVIGSVPIAAIWRLDHHHWHGLWLRLALGLAVLGVIYWTQRALHPSPLWGLGAALVFCGVWWAISWGDVRLVLRQVVRR